jgi:hypothetical protein
MNDQIIKLKKLQNVDVEILALREERERLPQELSQEQQALEDSKALLSQEENELKDLQVSHKEKEVALQSQEEHIKKLQGQLYQVKKNDEYRALENEIASSKADNSIIEEEILKLFDAIDEKKKIIEQKKQDVISAEGALKEKEKEVKERVAKLDIEIQGLDEQRSQLASNIDGEVLDMYERIIKAKKAQLAIVSIKDSACQGCFMHVRPQLINEVKLGKDLILCENCSRILYIEEDEQ